MYENAKPILFNTAMMTKILAGQKTMTRRVCKITVEQGRPVSHSMCARAEFPRRNMDGPCAEFFSKEGYYRGASHQQLSVGDVLYCREAFAVTSDIIRSDEQRAVLLDRRYIYRAGWQPGGGTVAVKWRPSIHMPRAAARCFLRITGVRVERLQSITPDDCKREGADPIPQRWDGQSYEFDSTGGHVFGFQEVWERTVPPADKSKYGWYADPFVWVYEFERLPTTV